MSINAITPTTPSILLTPLLSTMLLHNDQTPKTDNPAAALGTVQENTHLLPPVTLYNAHGILNKTTPNSLIAYA